MKAIQLLTLVHIGVIVAIIKSTVAAPPGSLPPKDVVNTKADNPAPSKQVTTGNSTPGRQTLNELLSRERSIGREKAMETKGGQSKKESEFTRGKEPSEIMMGDFQRPYGRQEGGSGSSKSSTPSTSPRKDKVRRVRRTSFNEVIDKTYYWPKGTDK